MVEVTPDGSVPCRKDPCCADSRGAPAPAHAECGKQKLRNELEALITRAAVSCDVGLVHMGEDRAYAARREAVLTDKIRPLVVDVLREEEKSRRYLHNNLLGRVQSELFEVLQALQPRPGLIDYGSLRAKVEAARKAADELGKQFTLEHGLLDEGSETGTFRMPASLIVDELERAMGGILVTSFPGPQLKKLLADLRGALASENKQLRGIDANRNAARLEKDLENTRLAHTRLAEEKREVEAELSRTKQALVESEHLHQHAKTRAQLHEQDLATLRKLVGEWREHHRAMVKERDAALGELDTLRKEVEDRRQHLGTAMQERDKALAEADKVRSNHAIERESYLYDNRRLHRDSSRVCQELTRLQEGLAKAEQQIEKLRQENTRLLEDRPNLVAQSEVAVRSDLLDKLKALEADFSRCCADKDRAYQVLSTMPAPSEIAKLEEENAQRREELKKLHDARSKEHLENTLQQDDLRKQLARAEAHNAGLRREVENHLAAQSYIASALGVETNGSWQPIKEHLTTPARPYIPQDLAAEMIATLERAGFGLQPGQPNTLWAMVCDCSAEVVRLRAREEAHRTTLREREWEQRQISDALVSARADAAERKGQIDALRQKISLLEHENHLLAERLGRAYQMEMDARRTLAETANRLDNTYKEMRTRVGALEKRVELLKSLKEVEGYSPENEDLKEEDA